MKVTIRSHVLILLNPSINNSVIYSSKPPRIKRYEFGGNLKPIKTDTFNRTSTSFGHNATRNDIEQFVNKIEEGSVTASNSGWQAKFYRMNDNVGIKAPSPKYDDGDVLGKNNIGEFFALKYLNKAAPEIAPKPIELIERKAKVDGTTKHLLAMEIVNGSPINKNNLTSESLATIIGHLFTLEKQGVNHFDLQNENILIENPTKVHIIDFGSFSILNNDGNIIYSEQSSRGENPSKFYSELAVDSSAQQKRARNFISKTALVYIPTQKSNPYTNFHSNIQNFEYRTLHDVLMEKAQTNPQQSKDFFKSYLQTKATSYHSKMKDFFASIKIDEFAKPEDKPEDIQNAKNSLEKAIRHEEVYGEVLKNPSENIIKTELAKMQLRYFSAFTDKTLKKDDIIRLHKSFVKTTEEYAKSATPIEKEYYDNSLLSMQSMQDDKIFFSGKESFSEERNILKALFEKAKVPEPNPPIKKSNVKIYTIVAGVLALGGTIAYLTKNKNTEKTTPNK